MNLPPSKLEKVDKKTESKTTPHVTAKMSAHEKIVQLVTSYNAGIKPQQEK